jgi:GNAT superfamily N-acetyltransferase
VSQDRDHHHRVDHTAVTVRPAQAADVRPLAAVLARAFYDDPPFAWMLPNPADRLGRLDRLFATIVRAEALGLGGVEVACAGGRILGGTIWLPPGHWQPGTGAQLRALPGFAWALGRRLGAGSALVSALARAHPREPHWYLYVIGVDPSRQGSGVAGPLLRTRLRRSDEGGQPAYLESSKPANVPLYEHFGFQVTGTPTLPGSAPVITAMWRSPAAPAPS